MRAVERARAQAGADAQGLVTTAIVGRDAVALFGGAKPLLGDWQRAAKALRKQLAAGALVVVRHGDGFELLARVAAEQVRSRAAELIVLDHGQSDDTPISTGNAEDDAYYAQFQVPDDLMW
ncbi:hypothetical protein D3C71_1295480 [compost metagenome]